MKNRSTGEVLHGQLCLTDFQTRGRGQRERIWESNAGENLMFTIVFTPSGAERLSVLTLACARAIVAQIEETIQQEAFIKWPNDVIIHQKKAAGILAESMFNGNSLDCLLIGIGINMNQNQFSDDLQTTAASLRQVFGAKINREEFLADLLLRVEHQYELWLKKSTKQLKAINQKMIGYGEWVELHVNENRFDKSLSYWASIR